MKKTIIIFVILAVAGAITVYFTAGKKDQVEYITAKVERGDIKQTVSETGMVKADSEIDLNFLNNGKIAKILIKIGDKIKIDQILAELDYSGLSIKEQEAQANLEIAQANLTKLLAGAATEEISVSQANVYKTQAIYEAAVREADKIQKIIEENIKQAKKTLNDLKSGAEDDVTTYEQAVTAAQTNLDNTQSSYQRSINNQQDIVLITMEDKLTITNTALDNINTIVTDDDAKNVLSVRNQTYLDNTNNNCDKAIKSLTSANNSLTGAKQNKISGNINQAASDGLTALNQTFTALNSCYSALENSIISSDFTQTELDVFKTNISAQLTVISAAISSVQTARQNLANAMLDYEINMAEAEENLKQKQASLDNAVIVAQNALASARISGEQKITTAQNSIDTARKAWQLAKAQLAQVKAPASAHDVILEQAKIKQARAVLGTVKNQISNSIIKAPVIGTISKVEYEIGEQTKATQPVISMLAEDNYEIEVLISETDIAKIKINDEAKITLDAFGENIKFSGKVFFIEPAETVIQDVIYYKVLVEFANDANPPAGPAAREQRGWRTPSNIKSGMTANVIITTAEKKNVLIMLSRAVIERNGGDKIVRVLVGDAVKEVPVQIGLRGDEGMVEVLGGVKEGDEVVTFMKEKK